MAPRRLAGSSSPGHEPIAAVIEAGDAGALLRNEVYYLDPLPRWSEGRVDVGVTNPTIASR